MTNLIDKIISEYSLFVQMLNLSDELSRDWFSMTNYERSTFMNEDDFVNVRLREFLHVYLISEEIKKGVRYA